MAESPEQCAARTAEINAVKANRTTAVGDLDELKEQIFRDMKTVKPARTLAQARMRALLVMAATLQTSLEILDQLSVISALDEQIAAMEAAYNAAGCGVPAS